MYILKVLSEVIFNNIYIYILRAIRPLFGHEQRTFL